MAVSIFLVFAFSLIILFPRAMLAAKLELEYKRLFDPKLKSREVKLLPYLIPYYGGVKLCENMGSDFMAHMSKVVGVLTVLCCKYNYIQSNGDYGWMVSGNKHLLQYGCIYA